MPDGLGGPGHTVENGVNVTIDRSDELFKALKAIANLQVMVGIPAGSARSDGPISNASLGYIHEFGSPAANIPARPFLFPAVNALHNQATDMLQKAAELEFAKKPQEARATLESLGLLAVNRVKARIVEGEFAPLAPATIAARQARGRSGSKPLIDTGQLLNSITYVIRKKS